MKTRGRHPLLGALLVANLSDRAGLLARLYSINTVHAFSHVMLIDSNMLMSALRQPIDVRSVDAKVPS